MKHHNEKVAAARGASWRKSMVSARLESQINPTKLRLARLKAGKTQQEIADKMVMAISSYCAVEKGHRGISRTGGEVIAGILGVKPFSIFKPFGQNKFKTFSK